jgi:hypothetical protein
VFRLTVIRAPLHSAARHPHTFFDEQGSVDNLKVSEGFQDHKFYSPNSNNDRPAATTTTCR